MKRGSKDGRTRRSERSRAFQVLYGSSFCPAHSLGELKRRFVSSLYAVPSEEEPEPITIEAGEEAESGPETFLRDLLKADDRGTDPVITQEAGEDPAGFAWDLTRGAWINREEIDRLIADFSRNWKVERLGRVELALLRLAMQELIFGEETPPKVILNEALELSRQFGDETSRAFVNGILDAALKALEAGSLRRAGGLLLK
ncbi:MAG: transcription antitermination factor NusB [Desulfovibrionaceae bacterium]|nr:transcription antitermination factor NusB [Desulfovibrionaceae bacterium]